MLSRTSKSLVSFTIETKNSEQTSPDSVCDSIKSRSQIIVDSKIEWFNQITAKLSCSRDDWFNKYIRFFMAVWFFCVQALNDDHTWGQL